MKTRCLYFAYGSNLDAEQMRRRCPGAAFVQKARLEGHTLNFVGHSANWGGPVATIRKHRGHTVPGVIYSLSRSDLARLDGFEGCPFVYERRVVSVRTRSGMRKVLVYVHTSTERGSRPSDKYLGVIYGAYQRLGFAKRGPREAA